jgi:hypothetical protein
MSRIHPTYSLLSGDREWVGNPCLLHVEAVIPHFTVIFHSIYKCSLVHVDPHLVEPVAVFLVGVSLHAVLLGAALGGHGGQRGQQGQAEQIGQHVDGGVDGGAVETPARLNRPTGPPRRRRLRYRAQEGGNALLLGHHVPRRRRRRRRRRLPTVLPPPRFSNRRHRVIQRPLRRSPPPPSPPPPSLYPSGPWQLLTRLYTKLRLQS